jgi:hypothetical protein
VIEGCGQIFRGLDSVNRSDAGMHPIPNGFGKVLDIAAANDSRIFFDS